MNTSFNISWINETNTNIYIQPKDKRNQESGFNITSLNLTWKVSSFENNKMIISLDFYDRHAISPNTTLDRLVIFFN